MKLQIKLESMTVSGKFLLRKCRKLREHEGRFVNRTFSSVITNLIKRLKERDKILKTTML